MRARSSRERSLSRVLYVPGNFNLTNLMPPKSTFFEIADEASLSVSVGSNSLIAMLSEHDVAKYTEDSQVVVQISRISQT